MELKAVSESVFVNSVLQKQDDEEDGITEGMTDDITTGKGTTSSISRNNWDPDECEGRRMLLQ